MNNLRLYTMINGTYMRPIQHGIQTAHIVSEMAVAYPDNLYFHEWARKHKTIIVLDGGWSADLEETYTRLCKITSSSLLTPNQRLPVSIFQEEHRALRGATTATGIILPEEIWSTFKEQDDDIAAAVSLGYTPGIIEKDLIGSVSLFEYDQARRIRDLMKDFQLAR